MMSPAHGVVKEERAKAFEEAAKLFDDYVSLLYVYARHGVSVQWVRSHLDQIRAKLMDKAARERE